MIDRSHLALLLALEETGTLAGAAQQLYLTQSALSHAVRKLEAHYGVAVWQKSGRRLRLTQAGQYLLRVAHRVLPQLQEADATLHRFAQGRRGLLRIGMECHPCYEWLISVVAPYLERWPDVDLDVAQQFRFNGLDALDHHQVDMVITSDPLNHQHFCNAPIFDYELLLVTGHQWRTTGPSHVQPQDLCDQVLFTFPVARERLDVYTQFFLPAHIEPRQQHPVEATEIMLQLVAAHRGVCTLPDWLANKVQADYPLRTWRLGAGGVHKTLYLVFREEDGNLDYLQNFVALARGEHKR